MKKFTLTRYGMKTKEGIVLVGHNGIPLMDKTRKEAKVMIQKEGDKIIKIIIKEV